MKWKVLTKLDSYIEAVNYDTIEAGDYEITESGALRLYTVLEITDFGVRFQTHRVYAPGAWKTIEPCE